MASSHSSDHSFTTPAKGGLQEAISEAIVAMRNHHSEVVKAGMDIAKMAEDTWEILASRNLNSEVVKSVLDSIKRGMATVTALIDASARIEKLAQENLMKLLALAATPPTTSDHTFTTPANSELLEAAFKEIVASAKRHRDNVQAGIDFLNAGIVFIKASIDSSAKIEKSLKENLVKLAQAASPPATPRKRRLASTPHTNPRKRRRDRINNATSTTAFTPSSDRIIKRARRC